jgi:chromosome partitioning protein
VALRRQRQMCIRDRFGTVYDITKYEGSLKTYRRAREAYDRVVDLVEQSVVVSWHQQIAAETE